MRKFLFMAGTALLMTLGIASCGNDNCKGGACQGDDMDKVYTGVLPAADCDGVRYTLTLDYDHHDNEGDYKLVETYLAADTTTVLGVRDLKTFASEGDFTVEKKDDKTYLKLVKDAKDSSTGSVDTPIYFLVDSDSTLTMTNQNLELANDSTGRMNYTLKLGK